MLHTKIMQIGPLVPETKIYKVFTIYGHGGHLFHVTNIIKKNIFISFSLKVYIHILVKNCPVVPEK